ncbi:MAG: DegT/DnrJ/EryC1/StrS family aminotransferase [Alphaproteobacteria bacterium]
MRDTSFLANLTAIRKLSQYMSEKFIPFALPEIGEEEINAITECMRSGWLTTGKIAKQFEQDLLSYLGNEGGHAVAVNSATMGLYLALEAFGVKAGDEVIVPTYTFSATGMTPVYLGAKPVLCDIDETTMNIDVTKIEALITNKTKAIVPVHFAGLACDMDSINAIAKKHSLVVIEDAAHALPSEFKGCKVGANSSDATVFSFYATKTITTGEGGMIVTNNDAVSDRLKIMRLHGISRDVFDRYTSKGANWHYNIVAAGAKCNLTDLAASIGVEQLKKADKFQKRRADIAAYYKKRFENLPIHLPADAESGSLHSWHLFVVRLKDGVGISRDDFIMKMAEEGVGCSVHFIPLHYHQFYQERFGYRKGAFTQAERVFQSALSLPIYTKMTDAEVEHVANSVLKLLS